MAAVLRMYKLRDAGDLDGARREMRQVLTVLVVPHHRWIAEGQLERLDDWKPSEGRRAKEMPGKAKQPRASKPRKPTTRRQSREEGTTLPRKAPPRKATTGKPR
jgi:hypothetical protein